MRNVPSVHLSCVGAVSAAGVGDDAAPVTGDDAWFLEDPELSAHFPMRAARVRDAHLSSPARDGRRASALLECALRQVVEALDSQHLGWRTRRVAIFLGTSSGGMRGATAWFDTGGPVDRLRVTYDGPVHEALSRVGIAGRPCVTVLGACASSTIAIGLGARAIEADTCDVALAGGFDEVVPFVMRGFASLKALTSHASPRPFAHGRDGMLLGEGACVFALLPKSERSYGVVSGFGMTTDAKHLTAPDPAAVALEAAILEALRQASFPNIDLVSPHATGTLANDRAEDRALSRVFREAAPKLPLFSTKARIGHTLGAAGALETLAGCRALALESIPSTPHPGGRDERLACTLHPGGAAPMNAFLKTSLAFGGVNATLVVTRDVRPRVDRPIRSVRRVAEASLHSIPDADPSVSVERWARLDDLCRLGIGCVRALSHSISDAARAGILVSHTFATLEVNTRFHASRGPRNGFTGDPRLFPYTSPNAVAAECAIAFGLRGPSFAMMGDDPGGVAELLLHAGDADEMVVLALHEKGEALGRLDPGAPATFARGALLRAVPLPS